MDSLNPYSPVLIKFRDAVLFGEDVLCSLFSTDATLQVYRDSFLIPMPNVQTNKISRQEGKLKEANTTSCLPSRKKKRTY